MTPNIKLSIDDPIFHLKLAAWRLERFMDDWAEPNGTAAENRFYKAASEVVSELLTFANRADMENKGIDLDLWHLLITGKED